MPPSYSHEDLNRALERLIEVLEQEFGDDIAGWGAASLVLLMSIVDLTGVDRQNIANHILFPNLEVEKKVKEKNYDKR